jgi:hypothetical protein
MGVKVIVNPRDPKGTNQTVLEADEQVYLEMDIIYTDGYKKVVKMFIHGGLVAPNNCDKAIHITMTEPEVVQ